MPAKLSLYNRDITQRSAEREYNRKVEEYNRQIAELEQQPMPQQELTNELITEAIQPEPPVWQVIGIEPATKNYPVSRVTVVAEFASQAEAEAWKAREDPYSEISNSIRTKPAEPQLAEIRGQTYEYVGKEAPASQFEKEKAQQLIKRREELAQKKTDYVNTALNEAAAGKYLTPEQKQAILKTDNIKIDGYTVSGKSALARLEARGSGIKKLEAGLPLTNFEKSAVGAAAIAEVNLFKEKQRESQKRIDYIVPKLKFSSAAEARAAGYTVTETPVISTAAADYSASLVGGTKFINDSGLVGSGFNGSSNNSLQNNINNQPNSLYYNTESPLGLPISPNGISLKLESFPRKPKESERTFTELIQRQQIRASEQSERVQRAEDAYRFLPGLRGDNYAQSLSRKIIASPITYTFGFGGFLASGAENTYLALKGFQEPSTRASTKTGLLIAAKETPKQLGAVYDIRTPAGAANIIITAATMGFGFFKAKSAAKAAETAKAEIFKAQKATVNADNYFYNNLQLGKPTLKPSTPGTPAVIPKVKSNFPAVLEVAKAQEAKLASKGLSLSLAVDELTGIKVKGISRSQGGVRLSSTTINPIINEFVANPKDLIQANRVQMLGEVSIIREAKNALAGKGTLPAPVNVVKTIDFIKKESNVAAKSLYGFRQPIKNIAVEEAVIYKNQFSPSSTFTESFEGQVNFGPLETLKLSSEQKRLGYDSYFYQRKDFTAPGAVRTKAVVKYYNELFDNVGEINAPFGKQSEFPTLLFKKPDWYFEVIKKDIIKPIEPPGKYTIIETSIGKKIIETRTGKTILEITKKAAVMDKKIAANLKQNEPQYFSEPGLGARQVLIQETIKEVKQKSKQLSGRTAKSKSLGAEPRAAESILKGTSPREGIFFIRDVLVKSAKVKAAKSRMFPLMTVQITKSASMISPISAKAQAQALKSLSLKLQSRKQFQSQLRTQAQAQLSTQAQLRAQSQLRIQSQLRTQAQLKTQAQLRTQQLTSLLNIKSDFSTKPPKPRKIKVPNDENNKFLFGKRAILQQAYNVYLKNKLRKLKKGKYQSQGYTQANKEPLSREAALGLGAQLADTYTNKSFTIRKAHGSPSARADLVNAWLLLQSKFKASKRNSNILVEKSAYAIDSQEEVAGIPYEAIKQKKRQAAYNFFNTKKRERLKFL